MKEKMDYLGFEAPFMPPRYEIGKVAAMKPMS